MFLVMRQCCPTSAAGFSILFGIAGFCAKRVYATRITEMSAPIPVRGLGAVPEVTQRPAPLDNVEEVCKDDADVALGCRRLGGNAETVEEDALLDTISRIEYAIRNKVTGGFSMKDVTQTEFQLDTLVGTEVLTAYVQEENRTSPPGSDWDIDRHAGVAVLLRGADLDPTEWVTTGLPQFAQSEGKYYIEVILHRGFADAQIGYATSDFKQHRGQDFLNTDHELYGLGVGDDSESWSVDGARQMIFQDGGEREWDGSWSQDGETTVVGCSLDFDSGEAWFSINGKWTQRAAFTIPAGKAVYPAITLFGRATYTTNDFRYRRCTGCVPWVAHVVSYNSWDYNRHLQDQRLTIPSKWSKTQFRSSELVRARVEDVLGFDAIVSFGDAVHQIPMSWIRARVTPGTVLLAWLSVADARLCPVVVQAASSGTVSGFMIVKMHGECFKNLGKGFGKGVAKQARDAMGRGRGGEPALELNASSYTISTSQVLAELYPAIGETLQWRVRTPMGSGVVTGFDVASRLVTIQLIRRGIKGGKISVAVSKIVGEGPAPSTVQCQALCKQLSRRLGVGIRASQVQQDGNVPLEVQPGIRNTVRLQEGDVTMALPAARYRFALQENDIATSLLNITAPTTNFSHTHGLLEGDLFYAGEPSVLGTSSGKGFGVHHIKTGKGVGKKELPPATLEQLEKARWALMGFFGVMPSATEVDASTLAFVPPEYVASINRLDEEILQARQWVLVAMTRMADYRNWGAGEIVKNTLELFFGSSDPAVADSVYEILEAVYVSLVNIVIRHEPVTVQHVNWGRVREIYPSQLYKSGKCTREEFDAGNCEGCKPTTLAYVFAHGANSQDSKGRRILNICPSFHKLNTGEDIGELDHKWKGTQVGTIIHEASHHLPTATTDVESWACNNNPPGEDFLADETGRMLNQVTVLSDPEELKALSRKAGLSTVADDARTASTGRSFPVGRFLANLGTQEPPSGQPAETKSVPIITNLGLVDFPLAALRTSSGSMVQVKLRSRAWNETNIPARLCYGFRACELLAKRHLTSDALSNADSYLYFIEVLAHELHKRKLP